jgi:hypothetical protein
MTSRGFPVAQTHDSLCTIKYFWSRVHYSPDPAMTEAVDLYPLQCNLLINGTVIQCLSSCIISRGCICFTEPRSFAPSPYSGANRLAPKIRWQRALPRLAQWGQANPDTWPCFLTLCYRFFVHMSQDLSPYSLTTTFVSASVAGL